jgi:ERCC4-related helicase
MAGKVKGVAKRERSAKAEAAFGWYSTDEQEIARRVRRGSEEAMRVRPQALHGDGIFGPYLVQSDARSYRVEIRSLGERLNSCECPDHLVNRLGTCKHVEAVLHWLRRRSPRKSRLAAERGSPQIEIFLDRSDERIKVRWPNDEVEGSRALLESLFAADGALLAEPLVGVPALMAALQSAPEELRRRVTLSAEVPRWFETLSREAGRRESRSAFVRDVAAGKRSLDFLKLPLLRYQQEGMLHLAFQERALLADEMGLGKTVQAIAACVLLHRLRGVQRVLVVAPASLKGEWAEQIAKFSGQSVLIVQGSRPQRLRQYRQQAFFYLSNYEQILVDRADIQATLAPEVVILDEAQRIKNWQTKTAAAVKLLKSRYAFVLTGTPLENRIDEVYSIVQFLDPRVLSPLFRFNREFYELDERGRPVGYKNLDELHRRLRPLMLRRRKDDVEGELPPRTTKNYFVPMHAEQQSRYEAHERRVAALVQAAERRPLTREEQDRLQQYLACMRMLCDTPYILDPDCRVSPKLDELESVLEELRADGGRKIIVFSEWERMLALVSELAETRGIGYVLHSGSVTQEHRREAIREFRGAPDCELFLSTDSGSVGLNLQVADVVINLDLPWNPAKLEQRIARAWRKHQTRPVMVINLVTEGSIEERMLRTLDHKQQLADGVIDGQSGVTELPLSAGREALLQRLGQLTSVSTTEPERPPEPDPDPCASLRKLALARLTDRLQRLELGPTVDGMRTLLAVVDQVDDKARAALEQAMDGRFPGVRVVLELLDRDTYQALARLMASGVMRPAVEGTHLLHPQISDEDDAEIRLRRARVTEATRQMELAQRKRRMAALLADGEFASEALTAMVEALNLAVTAGARLHALADEPATERATLTARLGEKGWCGPAVDSLLGVGSEQAAASEESASRFLADGAAELDRMADALERAQLS